MNAIATDQFIETRRDSSKERDDNPESFLTAEEVAQILSVPVSWVYEQTRRERIPHVKLGKYRRYKLSEILAWAESLHAGPRADFSPRRQKRGNRNSRHVKRSERTATMAA